MTGGYVVLAQDRTRTLVSKFERAHRHINEVNAEIRRFHERHPYSVVVQENQELKMRRFVLQVNEPVPEELGLAVGDAAHNLRSCLDHLAWQLVEVNKHVSGVAPDQNTSWPVWRKERPPTSADTKALVGGKLKGAHPDVLQLAQDMDTREGGGGHHVWLLDKLDLIDKHRVPLVTTSTNSVVNLDFSAQDRMIFEGMIANNPDLREFGTTVPFPTVSYGIIPAVTHVNHGDVLFSEPLEPDPSLNPEFIFDVSVDEATAPTTEPVLPLLVHLAEAVRGTIEAFTPYI